MAQTFQEYQPAMQPTFLQNAYGARWGSAFGLTKDQLLSYTKLGIAARFPNLAPLVALGLIGNERGIVQGVNETTAHYISRLLNAWGEWTIGGAYWGLLAQLYGAGYTTAYIVSANGFVYGPSNGITAPDPINGIAGNPPTWTQLPFFEATIPAPWTFGSGNGQGQNASPSPFTVNPPTFLSNKVLSDDGGPPDPTGNFWSRFVVMFDPYPASWTSVANPPTSSSSPSASEIKLIQEIIASFKPGKSTCVGILALNNGTRSCWAWPQTATTNIGRACWLSRSIIAGDAPSAGTFDATYAGQTVNSWLPATTYANQGGHSEIFTMPSFYKFNGHVYYTSASPVTTGLTEPVWPTTIGNSVSDGSITWTCTAQVSTFTSGAGSTCFQA